jgi:hypothetical protein
LPNTSIFELPSPSDWEIYKNAVQIAEGDFPDSWDEYDFAPPKEFVAYIERGKG